MLKNNGADVHFKFPTYLTNVGISHLTFGVLEDIINYCWEEALNVEQTFLRQTQSINEQEAKLARHLEMMSSLTSKSSTISTQIKQFEHEIQCQQSNLDLLNEIMGKDKFGISPDDKCWTPNIGQNREWLFLLTTLFTCIESCDNVLNELKHEIEYIEKTKNNDIFKCVQIIGCHTQTIHNLFKKIDQISELVGKNQRNFAAAAAVQCDSA